MASNCLVGCIAKCACQGTIFKEPQAEEGHTLAPWVRIKFNTQAEDENSITVGNESSPQTDQKNTAVIEKFQYGFSTGVTVKVEIHDEQGGSFVQFANNMVKKLSDLTSDANSMEIEFGWVKNSCNNQVLISSSKKVYVTPLNVFTSFSQGRIKYEIEGKDLVQPGQKTRINDTIGSAEQKMPLTQAIRKMFSDPPYPLITNIQFLENPNDNTPLSWNVGKNSAGKDTFNEEGPIGVWPTNGKQKFQAALDWIKSYRTKNNKGITAFWNVCNPLGGITFTEDPCPTCNQTKTMPCIGTFIVNGGNCSNVLSFEPRVEWNFQALANTGGGVNDGSVKAQQNPGKEECKTLNRESAEGGGTLITVNPNPNVVEVFSPKESTKEIGKSVAANLSANKPFFQSIQADLRIVGNPLLYCPQDTWGTVASIVVINPFHITPDSSSKCGEWLANPGCNPILTNKNWLVNKVEHQISAGNFTTTISVSLPVPGIDFDIGTSLGGPSSCGYIFPK